MSAELQPAVEPGIRSRVPWDEYQALPGLRISYLKEVGRSPQHYRHRLDHPKQTAPMRLGTAAHCAVLEPERFDRQFAVWARRSEKTGNLCPRNGQYWEHFLFEHGGKEIITEDEYTLAMAIQRAVRADTDAMRYLDVGDPEVTMLWQDTRQKKARVDWLTRIDGEHYLVGLKTARDCREYIFGTAAARLGYPMQWAWYAAGYEALTGVKPHVREIVVESEPPHAVVVYQIDDDILFQGEEECTRLLGVLEECEHSGKWPGPALGEQVLTLPSWYYPTNDDISELGLTW